MQFCRKFSFAAMTCFLGGTFGGRGPKNILVDQGDKGDEEHPKKEKEEEKKKKEEEKKKEKMSP